jgi:hypothetical protein
MQQAAHLILDGCAFIYLSCRDWPELPQLAWQAIPNTALYQLSMLI